MPLLLSIGLLCLVALAAGRLCAQIHVPRVTGYLLAGLLTGPSLAHIIGIPPLITTEQLDSLKPILDLALAMIVLFIGGNFHVKTMRRFGTKLIRISLIEMGITAALVGAAVLVSGSSPVAAGFLAIMAITTAPAATQMVVREYDSEGPLTDLVMTLIGLNNLTAIVAFVFLFHFAVTPDAPIAAVFIQLGLPLGIGIGSGFLMAYMDQRITATVERQILGLAMLAAISGGCWYLDVSAMPAMLAAGATLVNASPHGKRLLTDLNGVDFPLYVIFFVMAGAGLHLSYIPTMGIIGVAYIVARSAGKYLGSMLGSRVVKADSACRTWLGPAMLAQAGLAIGLATSLAQGWGEEGARVETAVLASVVVFEGIGPLLTRIALVQAGEVTVLSLLYQRSPVGVFEGLHEVLVHFRDAIGLPNGAFKTPSDILISHVMRRNVEVVGHDESFDSILKIFGHSRYDRLPVVDDNSNLLGVIQYSDVSEVLFEPSLRNLIVARDIVSEEHLLLTERDTLEKAMNELKTHQNHTSLLVVDDKNPKKLVGVVRHNDVLSVQRSLCDKA